MEKIQNQMEDPEDAGLKAVMGGRFRDLEQENSRKERSRLSRSHGRTAALWGAALGVFGWWLHTGQMAPSAAIPGMVFCGCLVGFHWAGVREGR